MFHILHPKFIQQFENDARTQVKFHIVMAWFWALTMAVIPFAFIPITAQDIFQITILEISLYANWSTEFGALAASQASFKADKVAIKEVQLVVD